ECLARGKLHDGPVERNGRIEVLACFRRGSARRRMGRPRSCHGCRTLAPAWERAQGHLVGPEVRLALVSVSRPATTDRPQSLHRRRWLHDCADGLGSEVFCREATPTPVKPRRTTPLPRPRAATATG